MLGAMYDNPTDARIDRDCKLTAAEINPVHVLIMHVARRMHVFILSLFSVGHAVTFVNVKYYTARRAITAACVLTPKLMTPGDEDTPYYWSTIQPGNTQIASGIFNRCSQNKGAAAALSRGSQGR